MSRTVGTGGVDGSLAPCCGKPGDLVHSLAGLYSGIYTSPVLSASVFGSLKPLDSSPAISLLKGKIPVTLQLEMTVDIVIALDQASEDSLQKSYWVTLFPGLKVTNRWHVSLQAAFNGEKHALSRGCVM